MDIIWSSEGLRNKRIITSDTFLNKNSKTACILSRKSSLIIRLFLSIKEVQEMLNEENPLSFNTIMTVMNRLLEKGHLKKYTKGKGRGHTSCYVAVQSKEEFLMEQMQAVTYGLIREYGDMVVTHIIDALDHVDPKLIADKTAEL